MKAGVKTKQVVIFKIVLKMGGTENTDATTTIQFDVSVTKKNAAGEVIDAIASGSKLTKADAGRSARDVSEDWVTITVEPGATDAELPKVTVNSHSKLTKADAGKTTNA